MSKKTNAAKRKPVKKPDFEHRVIEWVRTRLGLESTDPRERAMRLLEEAVELVQAEGIAYDRAIRQVDYVYGRPPGTPEQEAAGIAVCLYGWCGSRGMKLHDLVSKELARIEAKPLEEIRRSLKRKADADLVHAVPAPAEQMICQHYRLTRHGICRTCGEDRRGI